MTRLIYKTFTGTRTDWKDSSVLALLSSRGQNQQNMLCTAVQFDQPLQCALRVVKDLNLLQEHSNDSDQTRRMPRLIRVFKGCACHFVSFVMLQVILGAAWHDPFAKLYLQNLQILKNLDIKTIRGNHLKIWSRPLYRRVICPKHTNGKANSVDSDQNAPQPNLGLHCLCLNLPVQKLRIITVSLHYWKQLLLLKLQISYLLLNHACR